ncbi:hypothetical protein DPMN_146271 [Dreissena polymorpha]|uniref:Uncharacterized protein n=1 Tax=Dreissena polymorpha TaxID=45954 RepID=A0A9D4J261_DREPO|nr:hypothetical protein DPMN_146271 [Dreissena polymorpha]
MRADTTNYVWLSGHRSGWYIRFSPMRPGCNSRGSTDQNRIPDTMPDRWDFLRVLRLPNTTQGPANLKTITTK